MVFVYVYKCSNTSKCKVTIRKFSEEEEEEEEEEGAEEQSSTRCIVEGKAFRCEDFER